MLRTTPLRIALGASALAVAALAGSTASATSQFINTGGIYQPGTLSIVGLGLNESGLASAIEFTVTIGGSPTPVTLYAFCVDLFHNITVGIDNAHDIVTGAGDAQLAINLAYHSAALTVDSNGPTSGVSGAALTNTQIGEIGGLANLGGNLIATNAADLSNKLTAIQGAIWAVEYPAISITSPNPTVQGYLNGYITAAAAFTYKGPLSGIVADSGGTQAFVPTGSVPEPSTWAVMLVGFASVGLMARRRRLARAVA